MLRSQLGEDEHHHLFSYPPRPIVSRDHDRRRWKPNVEIAPNCPRCNSFNTKFCYYNNYSLSQPRYFCKGCRRYWTKGGSLRNVPIGGGCRRSRRAKAVRSSSATTSSVDHRVSHRVGSSGQDDNNPNNVGSYSCDHQGDSFMVSNNSSSSSSSSTIDLALVYAKFLNPARQDSNNSDHVLMPEFGRDQYFDSSDHVGLISRSTVNSEPNNYNIESHVDQFSQEPLSDAQFSLQNDELELNYQAQERVEERVNSESTGNLDQTCSYGLMQPLLGPQEPMGCHQDMFWSNSPLIMGSSFAWQANTQLQDFESVVTTDDHDHSADHSNPLDDNWSPFDLPSFEAFFKP